MSLTLYGPVDPGSTSYIHRQIDEQILQSIKREEYINLRGGRQSGKTSIIMALRRVLTQQGAASAYVDLSPIGEENLDIPLWLSAFGQAIHASIIPKDLQKSIPLPPTQINFFRDYMYEIVRLSGVRQPIIVFVDEVTAVPSSIRRPFFSTLRAMFNERADSGAPNESRLVLFLFSGSFDPDRFIRGNNSPFNVAKDFDTTNFDFSKEQVTELAKLLGVERARDEVYKWTGGHPYLTNRMLNLVGESNQISDAAKLILQDDSNLRHLGQRLKEVGEPVIQLALKIGRGEQIFCGMGLTDHLDHLLVMGLVKPNKDGNAVIRCEMYKQFLGLLSGMTEDSTSKPSKKSTLLNFLPPGPLRDHAVSLVDMAPTLVAENPALAAICMGTVLETVLLQVLESRSDLPIAIQTLNQEVQAGRLGNYLHIGPSKQHPSGWTLAQMIEVARICGLIKQTSSQVSHCIRDWRNLIHPAKFRKDYPSGVPPEVADAAIATGNLILSELV